MVSVNSATLEPLEMYVTLNTKGGIGLSNLASDKLKSLVGRDSGERSYPIWLLVNPKYPAVVYGIWRHVLDEIQDKVYREIQTRIDTTNIYIRSAVVDCGIVPNTLNWWGNEVSAEIKLFRELILEYNPKMLISFGAFAFEFMRRVYEIKPEKGPKYWSASVLKDAFDMSMEKFDVSNTNMIPLLRRVIESDKSIETESYFSQSDSEKYFHYVGAKIAEKIIENKTNLNIWIK